MLKINVVKRSDPRDLTLPPKYYAVPDYNVPISIRELKKEIARFTTVSGPDIGAVLDSLFEVLPDLLKRGHIIRLGDLGSLYPTFKCEGQESEEDVSALSIIKARVRFRTSKWLKQAMTHLEVIKTENGNTNGNGQTKSKK